MEPYNRNASIAFHSKSLEVLSIGALPPGSPRRDPIVRRSVYRMLFYCLSGSHVNAPPSRFPNGALIETDACLQIFPLHILPGPPVKGPSLQVLLAPTDRDVPFPDPSFICLSQSPFNDPLLQVPQRDPYGKRLLFPEPSFPYLPESQ